jgi:uncharacterized membrane protein HdeD (DUF308 family)
MSSISDSVSGYAPWKRGVAWWIVLIQGILLAILGGLIVARPADAGELFLYGVGIWFVATAAWVMVQALRGKDVSLSVMGLLAAGGSLVAGLSMLLPLLLGMAPDQQTMFASFSIALITIGVLTILSAFFERPEGGLSVPTLVRGTFQIVLGGYVLWAALTGTVVANQLRWIGIGAIVGGVALAVYSFFLYRQQKA